ncbi:centriolar coiled-coil protein of 110 kDa isoform X2 [Pogona vitticeps]
MEDYETFCKKQLARLQGAPGPEGTPPPAPHKKLSVIQFNGIPVLSPLLTLERKKELQQDRQKALDLEYCRRTSQKRILLHRIQEIVENVQMKKLPSLGDLDQSTTGNIHLDLESKGSSDFVTQSSNILPCSITPSVPVRPKGVPVVRRLDAHVVSSGKSLEETDHFLSQKPKDPCSSLSEERLCPEGSFSKPTNASPSNDAAKKDGVEMAAADAEGPDPYTMSLQNLLKKSKEYIQREQTRRSLRTSSRRNGSESHSDKENDSVKTSDLMKERGKLTGRSCIATAHDKSGFAKSSSSPQSSSVAKANTSLVASASFSKVDIPMRSGTPPVLDSDSDEDFRSPSFFELGSNIFRSFTGSYSKLPSPEPSMSPKMHRRRPRPSSMGHIVITNPVNSYELSPKEKGKAVELAVLGAGDKQTLPDPVPKMAEDFASFCPSRVQASHKSSADICDELVATKQNQVCQLSVTQQENKRFSVCPSEDGKLTLDSEGGSGTSFSNPSPAEEHPGSCPFTTQTKPNASGAQQISWQDKAKSSVPTELNKSYDVETPSPLLTQVQQMDTPGVALGKEHVLENGLEKVKRRLELDMESMQKENRPCVAITKSDAPETGRLCNQRCPTGSAFSVKSEMLERSVSDEEAVKQKMLAFEELKKQLEEQHAQQLSLLIAEQEREQERLQKEIAEQERRIKREKMAVAEVEIPRITISSGINLEWRKISDTHLFETVVTRMETIQSTNPESAGFTNTSLSGSTAEAPFYLWEPATSGKSVSASRSINRSKMRWSQVYSPEMKRKLNKISALAKGFLTRRLLQTEKLKHLKQTVKDTMEFIKNFQSEAPLKRGNVSAQDANLQDRVAAQLRAALYDIHDIFFKMDVSERMGILHHDREVRKEKMLRQLDKAKSSREKVTLSTATQKSLDRKKYMKASEMGMPNKKMIVKQKTLENRVLQPNQGQNAPIQRLLSRQGTPKTSVKGAEQNRKKPSESRVSNKVLSGVYAGRIQRKKPNVVTT